MACTAQDYRVLVHYRTDLTGMERVSHLYTIYLDRTRFECGLYAHRC